MEIERQARKSSIPDEPTEGEVIRFSVRCPDGKTIFRNFSGEEKVDILFHWVELNEEIEFEDEKRQFDLMYSYPPRSLAERR